MKILYLDHAAELGGAEHSLLALLRTVDRARFSPTLGCPPGRLADKAREIGVPVADLGLDKLQDRNPLRSLSRLRRGHTALRRILAPGQFDVVHTNTLRTSTYASGVAKRQGARFVWHVRDHEIPSWARGALLRRCDVAIAPSQFIAQAFRRSPKLRIVPNGVDLADVPGSEAAAAFRQSLGMPPKAAVVGCIGRIRPWKGQTYFVDVAARLAGRLPEARFLIVGATLFPDRGRDYVAELKEQASRLGVANRVIFAGQCETPFAALAAMDVVVNCSENEPFGRVLIEAMACRRPVVAFRSGAVPEIVVDGSTGLLVPFGDTVGMAEAVVDLVRNRTRAEAYGEAGRHRVEGRFTLAASTRGIEAVYGELSARREEEA